VNAGVVWNPFLAPEFTDGNMYSFSREKFIQGVRSKVFPARRQDSVIRAIRISAASQDFSRN
jgi:hypothetical protein